jgi:hypothetical protein
MMALFVCTVFTDTAARRSQEHIAPTCIAVLTAQPTLAADLSYGPLAAKSP